MVDFFDCRKYRLLTPRTRDLQRRRIKDERKRMLRRIRALFDTIILKFFMLTRDKIRIAIYEEMYEGARRENSNVN